MFIRVGLIKLQETNKIWIYPEHTVAAVLMEHHLPADLSLSFLKVGRRVMERVMAYLAIQELLIRSFIKPAHHFACLFYGVQKKTAHI